MGPQTSLAPPPFDLLRPGRAPTGMSAVLLPYRDRKVDWPAFEAHVARTTEAGLVPAVNMDTGFVDLLDRATRDEVLRRTSGITSSFVAGAFVADRAGDGLNLDAHVAATEAVQAAGGVPVVFPSHGLCGLVEEEAVAAHGRIGARCDRFIAFELGQVFSPTGRIYSLEAWRALLDIPACIGAKHSSLSRQPEWERLRVRDAVRPSFLVLTGNDLAIDMVMFGSDYLLGLSTFAPDLFARRDRQWAAGDPAFFELNDALQALGAFAFRPPVPAYRSSAAQFLHLRGWVGPDSLHPSAPGRPSTDVAVLRALGQRLGVLP